ncbi:MAG: ATP-binding protein [Candidatus Stygibacter australis]|nr:ATP-binding protein [Candidatus Stygibacter australis]MDP8320863.1 ATP-binding protein [Candidatus Stygibacter australis]
MILSFSVTNYLSFKEKETISFIANSDKNQENFYIETLGKYKILKMAGIFGANASGKTNLLISMKHLRDIVITDEQKKEDKIYRSAFAFDHTSRNNASVFEISFYHEMRFDYKIIFNDTQILREELYHYNPNKAEVYTRIVNKNGVSKLDFGSKIKISGKIKSALQSYLIKNRSLLATVGKVELDEQTLLLSRKWFFSHLKPIYSSKERLRDIAFIILQENPELKSNVIEYLKRADYNISDYSVDKMEIPEEIINQMKTDNEDLIKKMLEQKEITFNHLIKTKDGDKEYPLNENLESAGTNTYFNYAVILSYFQKYSGILIIDELESSLHPELFQFFVDSFMLNTKNSQLIFTSHYLPFLEDQEDIRKDVIWFTNKRDDGSTELYSLKDFDIRKELNFYRAYKVGKFSAKPVLGSAILPVEDNE